MGYNETPMKGKTMNHNKIVLVVVVVVSVTAFVFSKKVTDQVKFNEAKREHAAEWDADRKRILSKVNDSTLSRTERNEYRKTQYQFYDIVLNYNKI
jgi:ABC-type uncharacterized transport system fused permease/ATPase subunit